MSDSKLYFRSIDHTFCEPLYDILDDAKLDGLILITAVEAIPDNKNPNDIWCTYHGEVIERSDCKKSICSYYKSKSGRGKCSNKGSLYSFGDEVTFCVETRRQVEEVGFSVKEAPNV